MTISKTEISPILVLNGDQLNCGCCDHCEKKLAGLEEGHFWDKNKVILIEK